MFLGARSGNIKIGETDMDYISFGKGNKNLVIIPGLADGLRTVKGTAIPIAYLYRIYAKEYRVYVYSRKNRLETGYSTRDMARDLNTAMVTCGIKKAHILGISQGGMIAQYLAIDHPKIVDKLIIGVSISKQNHIVQEVITRWITMAQNNDYKQLLKDTIEKTYTKSKIKKYKALYPIILRIGKPKSFTRFIVQATSCINHNAFDELHKIKSPTLVIGGEKDLIVGPHASGEMAENIPHSKLVICYDIGHSAYEEKEFNQSAIAFLNSTTDN